MELLLICPHCQAKLSLSSRTCLACGGELQDLPREDRHYFIGSSAASETERPAAVAVIAVESYPETMLPDTARLETKDLSLCEALDRILNKGAVLFGEVMISVADIDLVYLGLKVILASMDTARGFSPLREGQRGPNLFDKGVC